MTAIALATEPLQIHTELQQEILARIDHGGLHVCEAELRHTLRWRDQTNGPLLDLLDELVRRGLIESAIHFRLTDHGRDHLPSDYAPRRRYGTPMLWKVRS
jgi:hypothetical protein